MKSLNKWEQRRMEIYFQIFRMILKEPRISYKNMAIKMGHTGRGRSNSNYYQHHLKMRKQTITKNPVCVLKSFESSKIKTCFCKIKNGESKQRIFKELLENGVEYVMFLVGTDDFFLTTRRKLDVNNLITNRESVLYDAIFTVPRSWKGGLCESISDLLTYDFELGMFKRELLAGPNWDKIDWNVYFMLREDCRLSFSEIGRNIGIDHKTAKSRCKEKILPCVNFAHYFFPRGYDFYRQTFLEIKTKYEKSFVKALETLTTTSYVYILEDTVCVNLFHDNSNKLLRTIQKLEEMGIIDSYRTYIPIDSNDKF